MGVRAGSCGVRLVLAALVLTSAAAGPAANAKDDAKLLVRRMVSLPLARQMLAAAEAAAVRSNVAVSIVIVDDRGTTILAERMDGAGHLSVDVALAKARTAANLETATADLSALYKKDGPEIATLGAILPLSGGIALIAGGVPVNDGSAVVGGIGVSGAAPEIDAQIAAAGAAALVAKP